MSLITRTDSKVEERFPLTANQKAIWLEQKLYPASPMYNVGGYFTIEGGVDEQVFVEAITQLAKETDTLCIQIREEAEQAYQVFADLPDCIMGVLDVSAETDPWEAAMAWMREDFGKPISLEAERLFNVKLIKLSEKRYVQYSKFHHIIIDGLGIALYGNRMAEIYRSLRTGEELSTNFYYKEFISADAEYRSSEHFEKDKAYWTDKFKTLPDALVSDQVHVSVEGTPPKETIAISRATFDRLAAICTEHKVTIFHYFLAVIYIYFSRFYQKKDWAIGLPILNRSSFKHKRTIGMFAGNIPLRMMVEDEHTILGLMQQIKGGLSESYRHQKFPFDELTRSINLIGKGRKRLFDIAFSYEKHSYGMNFDGAPTKTVPMSGGNGFDPLTVFVREYEDDEWIDIDFSYSPSYFEAAEVARMLGHFKYMVETLSDDIDQEIGQISILPPADKKALLEGFNQTETAYEKEKTLVQLFEEQALKTPEDVAVAFEDLVLTYNQLNEKANQLAHYLLEQHQPKSDEVIGILLERSEWMLVSMLGVMKAGSAYLPIDPDYPEQRVRYVIEDSGTAIVLSEEKFIDRQASENGVSLIDVKEIIHENTQNPKAQAKPSDLAYVIYTSGSTGKPKGVMVEHGNVHNFFVGMDQKVPVKEAENTLLAVTTISFDISVLELLWTLCRGFKVVIKPSYVQAPAGPKKSVSTQKMDFSLFYFASEVDPSDKYKLLIEGARFADQNGFSAIWTPERHFHDFGGIYPNPSVTSAAIATITKNIGIRSGSCVIPLHNPIRVAEEWSVVDNLSNGRVGLSFASGWVNNDFLAFSPGGFESRKERMTEGIEMVKRLWRGESIQLENPEGPGAEVKIYPQPIQQELPVWVTAAGSPKTFELAGKSGANLLTHLLGQTTEELGEKIAIYREARKKAGHEGGGNVTLMIHTFLDQDMEKVREQVRAPFRNYIKSSTGLMRMVAQSMGQDPDTLKGDNLEALLDHAYNRYFDTAALFGTPDSCLDMVNKLSLIGVDELGCLVDFGIEAQVTLDGLLHLNALKTNYQEQIIRTAQEVTATELIRRHQVTHLQCTPSTLKMMLMEQNAVPNMASLSCLMLGGEALPQQVADTVHEQLKVQLLNMYGPTETTIWSSISEVLPEEQITIGQPIANTNMYLLDKAMMPVPIGAIGDLYIGGDGVTRGYKNRTELTAERFMANPFRTAERMYKTGDQGRWLSDGNLEFLGRIDDQVKVRGYRIETGEIEHCLVKYPEIAEAAVAAVKHEDTTDMELLAGLVCRGENPDLEALIDFLRRELPAYMVPSRFVMLDQLPLTPNGKVDKRAMLEQAGEQLNMETAYKAPGTEMEKVLAEIWSDLLQIERVGARDHFFRLGGHSLTAMRMVSRILHDLGLELALKEVFENPTLEMLAAELAKKAYAGHEKLEPLPEQEHYPVSHAQRRLWVLDKLDEEHIAYNMPAAFEMKGELDFPSLQQAINAVVARHEALRTSFRSLEGMPAQEIHQQVDFNVQVHDLQQDTEQEARAEKIIREDAIEPFDLSKPELLRLQVIRLGEAENILVFNMHHIISDGWSTNILIEELMHFYHGFTTGRAPELPPLRIHYKEYCNWESDLLESKTGQELRSYWMDQLQGDLPVLHLPYDRPRPAVKTHRGAMASHQLNAELVAQLKQMSLNHEVSLYMTLIGVLNVLLHRHSGQNDIIIGTSTAGRQHPEFEKLIGFCVNTLPVRTQLNEQGGFDNLLEVVKKSVTGAFQHQRYPFDSLVDELETKRDMSRHAIFDVIAIVNNHEQTQLGFEGIEITPIHNPEPMSKFDLGFYFDENAEGINISVVYNVRLFDDERIARMLTHFEQLCIHAAEAPATPVQDMNMLPQKEQDLVNIFSTADQSSFPQPVTDMVGMFEQQAARTPDLIAIECEGRQLTYQELNERANQLAHGLLNAKGIEPGSTVALLAERSEWMVIGMLGILKARCVYLPLVPDLPKARIDGILEDADCQLVLLDEFQAGRASELPVASCTMSGLKHQDETNPGVSAALTDTAYIVFTSGSTGKPKGIKVAHTSVANYLSFIHDKVQLSEEDHVLQLASMNFDASFRDIMAPLTAGASISILTERDPEKMVEHIANGQVTGMLSLVPSVLSVLLSEWETRGVEKHRLRLLILSGEKLSLGLCEKARQLIGEEVLLFNFYGPSECTMTTTAFELPPSLDGLQEVPVGKPIPNTEVLILNGDQLAPLGVPGQIYIGGAGLALGYLKDNERTEAAFGAHPFRPGERVYKTGDLGLWQADGQIALIGRLDDQVKIRGLRVEPGEVEQQLQSLETVSRAVVLATENDKGEAALIAFIHSENQGVEVKTLRDDLRERLPEYMVPGRLIPVEDFPLTANGKVDRKALIELSRQGANKEKGDEAPRNALERGVHEIWTNILENPEIGIHDNFFAIGGHSLSAIRMAARIHKVMGIEVSLKEVFGHPTIADLCATFSEKGQTEFPEIKRTARAPHYPLSHAQRRLWVLSQFAETSSAYNILKVLRVQGELKMDVLERALYELVHHQEVLRTRFMSLDGEPVQIVDDQVELSLDFADLSTEDDREKQVLTLVQEEAQTPFDLNFAPLFRVWVRKLETSTFVLMLNMHHIISDGWSMTVLAKELMAVYQDLDQGQAPSLTELPVQYKDYSAWQNDLLNGAEMDHLRSYWHEKLAGDLPVLELPYDHPRPKVKSYRGASVAYHFDQSQTAQLHDLARKYDCTLFMLLMAATKALLYRYSGQQDIIVGTPVAGRRHTDLEGLIGVFVNTLAIRSDLDANTQFDDYLKQVKGNVTEAFLHDQYPFDSLVEELQIPRDLSRMPVFDVMVALNNNDQVQLDSDALQFEDLPRVDATSKFDLGFFFTEGETLSLRLDYCTDLFETVSIEYLLRHFEALCNHLLTATATPIGQLNMLSEWEKNRLLQTFNDTAVDYPDQYTLVSLFENQVRFDPGSIAVIFEGGSLTYEELNSRANGLAIQLMESFEISKDEVIPIMAERGEWLMVGLLGIMKAGAPYLPIDTACPSERLKYLLDDSNAKLLLVDQEYDQLIETGAKVAIGHFSEWDYEDHPNPEPLASTDDLAYVIYTSGSTGNPKGVMVEHKAIVNRLQWMEEEFSMDADDVFLQKTPYTFDVSVWELFLPMITGARLCLLPPGAEKDPASIAQVIATEEVTCIHFVPSMLEAFLHHCEAHADGLDLSSLKRVFASGEALTQHQVSHFYQWIGAPFEVSLINKYGPTEAAVDVSYFDCATSEQYATVPIGKPISNVRLHILDENDGLQAMRIPGELCIAGIALARGYMNREELTREKFVEHPLEEGGRLYRTGDLARWLPDGQIEYLGRIDDQVKIRGHRIEPGEVEHALYQHPQIRECVVLPVRGSDQNYELVAFIVTEHQDLESTSLINFLSRHLPDYMMPARFVAIDAIPVTRNGKTDKKALLKEQGKVLGSGIEYVEPSTPTEIRLVSIWKELLDRDPIGIRDNFFQLGGHSLKATRMIAHIHREFGCEITLRQVFEYPDIAQLAAEIDNTLWLQESHEEVEANNNSFTTTI